MIVGEHDNMQTVEHQWELINGSWYAFDEQGYLRVGLSYDAGMGIQGMERNLEW